MDIYRDIMSHLTQPPRKGVPAAELTDRDRLALCIAAGAPIEIEVIDGFLTVKTTVPCGIADRGDGGYIVAIAKASPDAGEG